MTDVKIDRLTILEAQERDGGLRRLVRVAEVSGIETDTWEALTDALDAAGIPQYGDVLTPDFQGSNAWELVLVGRNASIVDKGRVRVELVYENFLDLDVDLDNPRGGAAYGEVRCNIQQKTSNLDINGDQVTVEHTYPVDDPNHPNETIVQGGEFQYYEPQRTILIRGFKRTRTPWLIANGVTGKVNDRVFAGEAARTWLCTACTWRLKWIGYGANQYYMTFEFQFDADTWDPTVTFIDDVTNRPPPNLVADVGYKSITKLPSCNFEAVIGSRLQGG